jgi:hypothetical protein
MKILQLQYFTRTLDNYLRQEYLKVKPQPTRSFIPGVKSIHFVLNFSRSNNLNFGTVIMFCK